MVAIEESKDLSTMLVEDLQGRLEAHKIKINRRNPSQPHKALKSQGITAGGHGTYRGRGRGRISRGKGTIFQGGKGFSSYESNSNKEQNQNSREGSHDYQRGGHGYQKGQRGYQREKGRGYFKCYNCNKPGHVAKDCKNKQYEAGLMHENKSEKNNQDETLLLVCQGEEMDNVWYLDSAASKHMTGNKRYSQNYLN